MKLTIQIWGKGSEAFIHKITKEQYDRLLTLGVEDDKLDNIDISEVLNLNTMLDSDAIITGVYPNEFTIKVIDEENNIIWESHNYDFNEYTDGYLYNDGNYLLIDDYIKGNFFNYTLEIEDKFNPNLLIAETTELLDGVLELITNIKYGNVQMEKEYGDTESKGFNFSLFTEYC